MKRHESHYKIYIVHIILEKNDNMDIYIKVKNLRDDQLLKE